jgi:nucleoside-diphosphate-sugar epimerase
MAGRAPMSRLLCFGFGFCARTLAERVSKSGWLITGTSRTAEGCAEIAARGFAAVRFDALAPIDPSIIAGHDHILLSIPPDENGDPVLRWHVEHILANRRSVRWIGYLSSTAVYGDRGGGWVDESAPLVPSSERAARRVHAEEQWLGLCRICSLPVHIFRLAGIYGPGRNQLLSIRAGTARAIVKPGQVFSRIHVEDIAGVLEASIAAPRPARIYNVCDNEPAPPENVVAYAAELMSTPPPPRVDVALAGLSPMALSFYDDSKRVSNRRIKEELGYRLLYPTYREGLTALKATL